jgi:two-component system sensor histidine kinase/response regulator
LGEIVLSCRGALDRISGLFGVAISLQSMPEGEVLFETGPENLCRRFHRACTSTSEHCATVSQSLRDAVLAGNGQVVVCPCGNGLAEAAAPFVIGGRIVAAASAGQVFIEPPDEARLRLAAAEAGWDPDEYAAAAARMPVIAQERLAEILELIAEVAQAVGAKIEALRHSREAEASLAEALAEARRHGEFRDALLDAVPLPVFHKDSEGRYTGCNRAFTEFTGMAACDLLGRTAAEIWPQAMARAYADADVELRDKGGSQVFEFFVPAADGSLRNVVFSKRLLTDAVPGRPGIIGCFTDVTETRKREGDLAAARDAAQEAVRTKAAFLAAMSHEVRTPLNGIIGLSNILLETKLDAEQREISVLLRDSSEILLRLVNDILDFSKLEAGKVDLEESDFVLHRVCHSALSLLALQAECKGLSFCFHLSPDAPEIYHGDAGRLRQVLLNLLSNAIKFTEDGLVELSVAPRPPGSGPPALEFRVKDTGIGIPLEQQERLFHPYEQGGSSVQARYGGTGLGLSICHNLVALMKGTISLTSREGAGCTVTVALPLAANAPAAAPRPLAGRTVVVVESRAAQAANLGRIIEEGGGSVSIHSDLVDGLDQAAATTSAILLDGAIPAQRLAPLVSSIRSRRPRPLIAVLVPAGADTGTLGTLGCDAMLNKPVDPVDLVRVLTSDADRRAQPVLADAGFAARHPLRILVAEDEPSSLALMAAWLRHLGYNPDLATDGQEALRAASAKHFDLMMLDLGMPTMNGLETAAAIRALDHPSSGAHLVAVTAHVTAATRAACEAAGFDGFLAKPFAPEELMDCLGCARSPSPAALPA